MDFSKIPNSTLLRFLVDYPEVPLKGGTVPEQAAHLFNVLEQREKKVIYPEIIVDLQLGAQLQPKLELTEKYTFENIRLLTSEELTKFGEILGISENLSRSRIYSILELMGAIETLSPQKILGSDIILSRVCSNLTFDEAVKLQVSQQFRDLPCELPVNYEDGLVKTLPGVNKYTKLLNYLLSIYGAEATISIILDPNFIYEYDDIYVASESDKFNLSKQDQIKLLKILLPRISDILTLKSILFLGGTETEILKIFIESGVNLREDQKFGQRLLTGEVLVDKNIKNIELLLASGVDPNFELDPVDTDESWSTNIFKLFQSSERPSLLAVVKRLMARTEDESLRTYQTYTQSSLSQIAKALEAAGAREFIEVEN